jgi:hypothetical protein
VTEAVVITGVRRRPLAFLAAALLVATAIGGGAAVAVYLLAHGSTPAPTHVPPLVDRAGLVERSGVKVVRVAVTGDGGLVDLRFKVVDQDKAASLHDWPPLLVDETTGGVVNRPWMGHVHTHGVKLGVGYYVIFENTGMLIRPGSRVTVQLGDARLPHVPVQ